MLKLLVCLFVWKNCYAIDCWISSEKVRDDRLMLFNICDESVDFSCKNLNIQREAQIIKNVKPKHLKTGVIDEVCFGDCLITFLIQLEEGGYPAGVTDYIVLRANKIIGAPLAFSYKSMLGVDVCLGWCDRSLVNCLVLRLIVTNPKGIVVEEDQDILETPDLFVTKRFDHGFYIQTPSYSSGEREKHAQMLAYLASDIRGYRS